MFAPLFLPTALAEEARLPAKMAAMASGAAINTTENRAVMHVALRAAPQDSYVVDGQNVVPDVHRVLDKIRAFSDRVRSGAHRGCTGKALTDIVAIGIGGSYLGAEFVAEVRCISNVSQKQDNRFVRLFAISQHCRTRSLIVCAFCESISCTRRAPVAAHGRCGAGGRVGSPPLLFGQCGPRGGGARARGIPARDDAGGHYQQDLYDRRDHAQCSHGIACSFFLSLSVRVILLKFTREYCMSRIFHCQSAQVRRWLTSALGDAPAVVAQHMVAVSTAVDKATAFGVNADNIFAFWDWVGGRYSVSSAVGVLPLALQFGFDTMQRFLAGARSIDQHFLSAPLARNLPVLLGLLGVWNATFLGHACRALLPYSQALHRFAPHIQQVDMESNGKRVALDGTPLDFECGPINFGEPGTNGQHSFYQLVHQGRTVPCDFIGFVESQHALRDASEVVSNHDELMSNFFAQPDALVRGARVAHPLCSFFSVLSVFSS